MDRSAIRRSRFGMLRGGDEERVLDWKVRYWEKAKGRACRSTVTWNFIAISVDGVPRNLRYWAYSRPVYRDGKRNYLEDSTRSWVMSCSGGGITRLIAGIVDEIEGKTENERGHPF